MPTLPCENGGGSLNNPNGSASQLGTNNDYLKPYNPNTTTPCQGEWEISTITPDSCATNEQARQESYVAESLNISGAPINVFKLLGVHEQGHGSLIDDAKIIASTAYPGYPASNINSGSLSWRSIQAGAGVVGAAYVGADFGIKLMWNGDSEYDAHRQKWTKVAALTITQANTPNEWARQVRVEIADGKCEALSPVFSGVGNGTLNVQSMGSNVTQGVVTAIAVTSTTFNVYATLPDSSVIGLNTATINVPFSSTFINFTIHSGSIPFAPGDIFTIYVNYVWKRAGIFNLIQSPSAQVMNLQTTVSVKAIRVTPTMFTGTGNWEVFALDVLDSAPTDINNIQDLFFGENRDRDYALEPILLKAQYSPTDSINDLSKFGLSILDQYSFTISFATMVQKLGRPVVVGDILEVIPEMQYDQNLKPVRKFLEVTDTGWAAEGFSSNWRPTVYRFSAQQALPSQETRDIFGTLDTQKYLVADSIISDGISEQLDTTPLTIAEEIKKEAADAVPEVGTDDNRTTMGKIAQIPFPPVNPKGQPPAPPNPDPRHKRGIYIEDGLPPNGEPYGEGFKLPDVLTVSDGDYFRLYYPPETRIAPRLYRYSALKNRWIFVEQDRRGDYSSHKPSVRSILQSDTKRSLEKKLT
jgi:hypothetical protein